MNSFTFWLRELLHHCIDICPEHCCCLQRCEPDREVPLLHVSYKCSHTHTHTHTNTHTHTHTHTGARVGKQSRLWCLKFRGTRPVSPWSCSQSFYLRGGGKSSITPEDWQLQTGSNACVSPVCQRPLYLCHSQSCICAWWQVDGRLI